MPTASRPNVAGYRTSFKVEVHETYVDMFRRLCRLIVEHRLVVGLTTVLTVYVLLSEDLKVMLLDRPADETIGYLSVMCMVIFGLEILLSSIGKDDYFLGFFFWLDAVSTASLILDLPWISDAMNESESNTMVSDAERGRTARIGARSARVVRVIRLVRIAKLYKAVYESTSKKKTPDCGNKPGDDPDEEHAGSESRVGKKLSDVTTRRVIVLVLSMLVILPSLSIDASIKMPTSGQFGADQVWLALRDAGEVGSETHKAYQRTLLRYIYYHNWFSGNSECPSGKDSPACPQTFASHLYWVGFTGSNLSEVQEYAHKAQLQPDVVQAWADYIATQNEIYNYGDFPASALPILYSSWTKCTGKDFSSGERVGFSLLRDKISGFIDWTVPCWHSLRPTERSMVSPSAVALSESGRLRIDFWFDERPYSKLEAAFSIGTTMFVCVMLCGAAMLLYNDVNQLVLYPVEEMVMMVQAIRDNPLRAVDLAEKAYNKEVKTGEEEQTLNLTAKDRLKTRLSQAKRCLGCYSQKASEPMEMMILEKTIIKLGSLLALGFGEAGSQIIASNMSGGSYGVNVMVPGQRIECVIGHARIQNFSVVTEVLQSRVMTFVNQVAEIVHGVVEEHHGTANKNNGDTFLLVWRCSRDPSDTLGAEDADGGLRSPAKFSELSVLAFTKIIGAVHRSSTLAHYRGHPGLQNKLGSLYRVHLTCGVHRGWAIEGAVGSEYKIEASYLSPNVAVATNVEAACEIYNVCFLASEAVVALCSKRMQNKCRLVDRVLVPGARDPFELYSMDLDWSMVKVEDGGGGIMQFRARERMIARQYLEIQKRKKLDEGIVPTLYDTDPDIKAMRRGEQEVFTEHFRMGYQNYVDGEWQVAHRFLEETCTMREAIDGPSWALIRFMEKPFNFEAPYDWQGVHDLSSVLRGSGLGDLGEISRQLAWVAQKKGFKGGPVMNTRSRATKLYSSPNYRS